MSFCPVFRSNAVYVPVFRSKAMGQSIDCPIFQFISGKTGSLAFRRFSRVYSFRILAVSSHRLLFGSSGLPYCGKLAHPRIVASLQCRVCHVFRSKQQKTARNCAVSAFWSEIDGITHIVFLSFSFAIRDIFFFAHYGFLQVRQVCARRKLAHPRIVTSFQCRVRHVFRSKQQKTARNCAVFCCLERKTGFEPATTGLGSRDSTVELLSPSL